jgi:hypothetical protein
VKEDGEGVVGQVSLPGVDDVAVTAGGAAANDGGPAGVVDRDLCPEGTTTRAQVGGTQIVLGLFISPGNGSGS